MVKREGRGWCRTSGRSRRNKGFSLSKPLLLSFIIFSFFCQTSAHFSCLNVSAFSLRSLPFPIFLIPPPSLSLFFFLDFLICVDHVLQFFGRVSSGWEGRFSAFWKILEDSGRFWKILGDSGRFWEILKESGRNESITRRMRKERSM